MTFGKTPVRASDEGDTLIEILITIMVLGITVAGLIGALTLGISSTDAHRRLTNIEVFSRAYGERVVDQAMHPTSTTLNGAVSSGDPSITVTSSSGFASLATPFTAAVDGEVVSVTNINGTTWTVSGLSDSHPNNSLVTKYQTCPNASDLFVSGFTIPATERVTAPTVANITNVEYFDSTGNAVPAASCATYWSTTALPCSRFQTPDHLTECDPPVIRVTFKLDSTDVGTTTGATTTTSVLIRRSNT